MLLFHISSTEEDNPHIIEDLMSRTGGRFNTLRIVPMITFQTLLERCKQVDEGTFFPEINNIVG
jgi:hypothetical protein